MYRNVICLVVGLIIGIRLTDLWDYVMVTKCPMPKNAGIVLSQSSSSLSIASTVGNPHAEINELNNWLFQHTRVLCFVLTMPDNHQLKAIKVMETWGKRCNKLIFMSTMEDEALGAVKLNVSEGRDHLYKKVRASLTYIYEHYVDDYDWFLKADDDTYVIMENLRLFLYPYDTETAVYFGCKFRPYVTQGYMSGGAGYVLSREAIRRYYLFARNNTKFCWPYGTSEDKEIGRCLQNVGVVAGDSRDVYGRERFLPLAPRHLMPEIVSNTWLDRFWFYTPNKTDCCSDTAISFHYTKPFDFDIFEYLLYNLHTIGSSRRPAILPQRLNTTQMKAQLELWANASSDNIAAWTSQPVATARAPNSLPNSDIVLPPHSNSNSNHRQ